MSDLRARAEQISRVSGRWTILFASAAGIITQLYWDWRMSLGVALGALIGHLHFSLLARAVANLLTPRGGQQGTETDALRGVQADGLPEEAGDPAGGAKWTFRVVLLALALVGILWYMPARPEGVALGLVLALLAAVIGGISTERHRP